MRCDSWPNNRNTTIVDHPGHVSELARVSDQHRNLPNTRVSPFIELEAITKLFCLHQHRGCRPPPLHRRGTDITSTSPDSAHIIVFLSSCRSLLCLSRAPVVTAHIVASARRRGAAEQSNIMVCTCELPSNFLLPCAHVMAVNQHVFHQPVIFAQVGERWRRDQQPATIQQQWLDQMPQLSSVIDTDVSSVAEEWEFDLPEDEAERKNVAWEMGRDDMYAIMDELIQCSRERPAVMDIIRDFMRELKATVNRRLVGDYSNNTDLSRQVLGGGVHDDPEDRLRNPFPRDSSKRQKRFPGRAEIGPRGTMAVSGSTSSSATMTQ
jgi:hypothetical protein